MFAGRDQNIGAPIRALKSLVQNRDIDGLMVHFSSLLSWASAIPESDKRYFISISHIPHHPLTRHYGTGQILDTLLKTSFKAGGAECEYIIHKSHNVF